MQKTIIGIFDDRSDVEETVDRLHREGFNPKDISIVMKDRREQDEISQDTGTNVAEGALSGATTGAVVGGIAGLLAGTVLPGIGGFLIGGPIGAALGLTGAAATTVSGAATGAVAGGLLGALMSLGLDQNDATHYEERLREGAILVAVPINSGEESIVVDIFDTFNAQDIKTVSHENEEPSSRLIHRDAHARFATGAKGGTSSTRKTRRVTRK